MCSQAFMCKASFSDRFIKYLLLIRSKMVDKPISVVEDSQYHRISLDKQLLADYYGQGGKHHYMDNSRLDPERIAELIRFRPSDVANAINGIGDLTEYDIRVALSKQATLGTIKGLRLLEYPEAVKDAMAIVKSHYNSEKIRKKRNRNIALFGLPVVA